MVVLTAARSAGEITVLNPRATRADFSIDLRFGFATTDSAGKLRVELSDGPDSSSAAGWISAYPSRFSLAAGATRTVRLLARPPANIADGEYWARITVHAKDNESVQLVNADGEKASVARIAMETATVLPVFYRKGNVTTGVTIGATDAVARDSTVVIRATLTRNGGGAYISVARISVRDSAGRTLATMDRQLAVYRTMRPEWHMAVPGAALLRNCSVEIRLSTDRHDVARNLLLQAPPVSASIPIHDEGDAQPESL
jgi:P pilus assembly chaperone PapD